MYTLFGSDDLVESIILISISYGVYEQQILVDILSEVTDDSVERVQLDT